MELYIVADRYLDHAANGEATTLLKALQRCRVLNEHGRQWYGVSDRFRVAVAPIFDRVDARRRSRCER